MAGSVNKVILLGNLGKDPEVKTFQDGNMCCNFSIATSESWRDKQSGERREKTEWHSISISQDALAKVAQRYLKKGSKVYIEGQLQTRKWQDNSGNDRYMTEVVLKGFGGKLVLLDGKGGDGNEGQAETKPGAGADIKPLGSEDLDDQIPF